MYSVVDELRIAGLSSIKNAFVSLKEGEYVIDTDGTALEEILGSGDLVDYRRCYSNSVHESFACLGIEAARNVIRKETQDVIDDSGYIAVCHLDLLAERMNTAGQPLPVTRHGMKRGKQGVLVSASFERTVDCFLHAAIHNETDKAGGVTEAIVMGRLPKMGTGFASVINDKEMLKKAQAKQQHGMAEEERPVRFIGRRRGAYRQKKESLYWDFFSDPIHRVHAMHKRSYRAFTPPPLSTEMQVDDEDPATPPTPEDCTTPTDFMDTAPDALPFGLWRISFKEPEKPVWPISMLMPEVVRSL